MLAYFEFLRVRGPTDPMPEPGSLPPAFWSYHFTMRRGADPVRRDFGPAGRMSWSDFVEAFDRYREDKRVSRLRIDQKPCRNTFNEFGIRRLDNMITGPVPAGNDAGTGLPVGR
jgi:hypothetical protein